MGSTPAVAAVTPQIPAVKRFKVLFGGKDFWGMVRGEWVRTRKERCILESGFWEEGTDFLGSPLSSGALVPCLDL